MDYLKGKIVKLLTDFFEEDYKRINHALEVLRYTETIAADYQDYDPDILITAALLHDVGIKPSEEKYNYNNGKTQEELGPPVAEKLLNSINFPKEKIKIICQIIGNHHSPSRYNYPELEILKTADKIVNKQES